mgnify:CR=1 FL=1
MKRIPRRLFTEEFKREAINLVTEQHLNVADVSRQLDVDPKSILSIQGVNATLSDITSLGVW